MNKELEIDFEKLYKLALSKNEVEQLESNLFELYQLNRYTYDIRRLFNNRHLDNNAKIETLKKIFGPKASSLFYSLIFLFLEKKILHKIYYLYEGFSNMVNQKTNRIIIQAYTPIELPIENINSMKPKLEKIFNKKVTLKNFVDKKLIGGMYLKLPNGKIYDFSYKASLLNLKYILMEKK